MADPMRILWLDPPILEVPDSLRQAVGGIPLVAETLARRGVRTPEAAQAFLDPAAYSPADPTDFPDLTRAAERLQRAIQHGERIAIWGDFDADGQTSTALLLEVLGALGADVVYRVPTRHEGHGLHKGGVKQLVEGGTDLILTCDTGVMAHEAVGLANGMGAEVIITDHHVMGASLPPALAVVNPHRLPAEHPMSTLPGVGVAYELVRALDPETADGALDLVALGTVADVATLTGDARYLVQRGLQALRHTQRLGLQAVYREAKLRPEGITEEHIGFVLGPRLNALGRLSDASQGVELLTTGDRTRARTLATEVEGLNAKRRWEMKQVTEAALAQIERQPELLGYEVLVLSHPTWPGGIVGIVAGRLAERFGKPAVLISAPPGGVARGSGRSVPGVDLIAALTDCAPLLRGFGGHKAAAGFSLNPGLDPQRVERLRAALSRAVAGRSEAIEKPALAIDAYVKLPDLTLDLVAEISRLAPFGPGNPSLTLAARDLVVVSDASIGRTQEHLRVTVEDTENRRQTVFWWQGVGWPLPQGRFDLAFHVRANDYRGNLDVQVEWVEARQLSPGPIEVQPAPSMPIRDYRWTGRPEEILAEVRTQGPVEVWAEGAARPGGKCAARHQLASGSRLVIWTSPPSLHVLQLALDRVRPKEVVVFAIDPGLDERHAFLARLVGLVKYALRAKAGEVDLQQMAAALAQTGSAVEAGLDWLDANGTVTVLDRGEAVWRLEPGDGLPDGDEQPLARARLEALLVEVAAYRDYFRNTPVEALANFLSLPGDG